jgi:hypothetical protein
LSNWGASGTPSATPAPSASAASPNAPQVHVGSVRSQACTSHYELYSSHVKWVNDCPSLSELPTTPGTAQ